MKNFYGAYRDGYYDAIHMPMRGVMTAMGTAMWHFAQLKEMTWYCYGYQGITNALHGLEHVYGEHIDDFKQILAQLGLPLEYPTIDGMESQPENLVGMFDYAIGLIDNVNRALSDFIDVTDNDKWEPLARRAENIQMANYAPKAWLMQARTMAEQENSAASIDNWLARTLKPTVG